MVLHELKDVLQDYVAQHDFLSNSAQRAINYINLFETGELPQPAAVHNIETVLKQVMPNLNVDEFEKKLRFNEFLSQVLDNMKAE